jgi:RNA recognition motif-containing protein
MNIYVGNLPFSTDEDDLRQAFEAYGQVEDVKLIKDKYTGKSRGFGFVEMSAEAEALSAIDGLNGKDFKGRNLTVNKARPRSEGGSRGGRKRSW